MEGESQPVLSRRSLIRMGSAGVVLGGVQRQQLGRLAAKLVQQAPTDLFSSATHFTPHVRSSFQGGSTGNLTLTKVDSAVTPTEENSKGARFSLLFDGGRSSPFGQGTYALRHAVLGTFSVFLVPVDRNGRLYQAVINRSRG